MATYVGYFRPNPNYSAYRDEMFITGEWEPAAGSQPDGIMADKVRGFPDFLESIGVKFLGSYVPVGLPPNNPENPPGFSIIETDDDSKLIQIITYYAPFLDYSFYRYNAPNRPQ